MALANWMPYLGQSFFQDSPDAQAFLNELRKYDPNAALVSNVTVNNPNGGYELQYDITKLPKNVLGQNGTFGISSDVDPSHLKDPTLVYDDPVYGRVTPSSNVKNSSTWIDVVGPLAVAGIAGAGGMGLLDSVFFPGASAAEGATGAAGAIGGMAPGEGGMIGPGLSSYLDIAGPNIPLTAGELGTIPDMTSMAPGEGAMIGPGLSSVGDLSTGGGLLSTIGNAAKTVGNSLSALQKSGLLGDTGAPAGTGGGGGGGGGLLGRGGGAPVVPGTPTEAELLAAMMRRKGLSGYLNFGGNNG